MVYVNTLPSVPCKS